MPREWGLHGLPPVGAACAGRKPLSPLRGQLPPSHRNAPLGRSGVAHGFFSEKSIRCSFLQNAHASGSLRSPYGCLRARSLPCVRGGGRRMPDGGVTPLAVNFLGSLPSLTATRIPSDARSRCRGRRAVWAGPRGCAAPERESGAGAAKVLPREWGLRGLPPVGAACAGREKLSGERLVRRGAPLSPLRGQLPLHRGAKETMPEASPYTGEPRRRRPKPPLCKGRWQANA